MADDVPLLIISGSMGAGKTTVLAEVSDLLTEADIPHGAIDLDWLGQMHPRQGTYGEDLIFANLAAIWPQYKAAGAQRLIVARVVEHRRDRRRYEEAVPGAKILVCRLTASSKAMQSRLRIREPGRFQAEALERSIKLDAILQEAGVEDFEVGNDDGSSVTDVARKILAEAGWI